MDPWDSRGAALAAENPARSSQGSSWKCCIERARAIARKSHRISSRSIARADAARPREGTGLPYPRNFFSADAPARHTRDIGAERRWGAPSQFDFSHGHPRLTEMGAAAKPVAGRIYTLS
jgi:hypothetical protein